MNKKHLKFMKEAVMEAKKGLKENGIPIGAVLVEKWGNCWPGP